MKFSNRKAVTLDDIFEEADTLGLLDVKAKERPRADGKLHQEFDEITLFFERHGHWPRPDAPPPECFLATRHKAFQDKHRDDPALIARDRYGLLTAPLPVAAVAEVASLQDIFDTDDDLLDVGDLSVLDIVHVPAESERVDDIAIRTVCRDFVHFAPVFVQLHESLRSGDAEAIRFADNWQIRVDDAFILQGVICHVAEMGETHERGTKVDARLRLIFENGTESGMLSRSLARALNKDEHGQRILKNRSQALMESFHPGQRTGVIYIVKTLSDDPLLTQYPHLYKIGYTEKTPAERLANAERDIAFLERPVSLVTEFQCFNMNPQKLEALIHAFLFAQRLNLTLTSRDGSDYHPREWFAVELDVARAIIGYILDGTINQYRMDNTTGRIVMKLGSTP